MALLESGSDIGPNSLAMLPFEEQEFTDFCTGEILVSAIRGRTDYQCMGGPPAEAFVGLGPLIQQEVQNQVATAQTNTVVQTALNQQTVDAASAPVISDAAISSAPNAVPVGSANALSPFTQRQLDAANGDPINWPATLTIQATMARAAQIKRARALRRPNGQAPTGMQPGSATQLQAYQPGMQPYPGWGSPSGSRQGCCGVTPWGKLMLFAGLGLIGASLLRK